MVHIALMASLMAVCAWISVPSPIPFTMQTFAIYLSLMLIGGKKGTCAITLYILLGLAGVPVFSGGGSGIGYILGPTGGYALGFVLCGFTYITAEKLLRKASHPLITLSIGTLLCYTTGTVWFMLSTDTKLLEAVILCVVPYFAPDALKLFAAFQISKRLRKFTLSNKE